MSGRHGVIKEYDATACEIDCGLRDYLILIVHDLFAPLRDASPCRAALLSVNGRYSPRSQCSCHGGRRLSQAVAPFPRD
jgi:hypothetical protein